MRNFANPSRYIQGENALFENAQSISELGTHPVLLCDSVVYDIVGKRFEEYLGQNGLTVLPVFFNGEASDNEINRVVSLAEENGCDLVIGLGGGKTIDSAKAIADLLKSPVVIAPTIASTDAPFPPCRLSIRMRVPLSAISSILRTQNWSWWIAKSSLKHQNVCSLLESQMD